MRAFDKFYPSLISDDGKKKLLVKLYRYTYTTNIVQGLAGGTGDLKELVHAYHRRCEKFQAPKPQQPTILIVDNDQGSKGKHGIFSAAKIVSKLPVVDGTSQFYHIVDNLYLVPTPLLPTGKDSMIEDFLESGVRKTVLNGKTLNLDEKTFDSKKHYGKAIFAKNVVQKGAGKIKFDGYKPLLDAVNAAIQDYKSKLGP